MEKRKTLKRRRDKENIEVIGVIFRMFHVVYRKEALKALQKIPRKWQQRILKAIEGLKKHPYQGKKLQGALEGLLSFRVWPYRIIYFLRKEKATIIIIDIGYRWLDE